MIGQRPTFFAAAVMAAAFLLWAPSAPAAQLQPEVGPTGVAVFRATGLGLSERAAEFLRTVPADRWQEILAVRVASADASAPAIAGACALDGSGTLVFRPRYPLVPGVRYVATLVEPRLKTLLDAQGIGWREATARFDMITCQVEVPAPDATPVAVVTQVYPTADVLPENQLKFYVHFSAPMQQGGAYRHLKLYDGGGAPVELPFLELDEELWDRTGTRFTLFIDPGRIKLGVKPREDVGAALHEGGRFVLVIEDTWPDADGRRLKAEHRKVFQVAPADRASPDPTQWTLHPPPRDSRDPLVVEFGESLDHALLQRLVWVHRRAGAALTGEATIGPHESSWTFVPATPWAAGDYELRVGSVLEDLAGNSIARPFDRDLAADGKPVRETGETVSVVFAVR